MLEMVTRYRLSILKPILLLAFLAYIVSCDKNPTTIWSTEARSPDGLWVAIIHRDQYSGPGNAYLGSTVYLKRTAGRQDLIEVLEFEETQPVELKLNWLTYTHLEVDYKQPVTINFQAVKAAGIVISVRDLSGPATDTGAANTNNCAPYLDSSPRVNTKRAPRSPR